MPRGPGRVAAGVDHASAGGPAAPARAALVPARYAPGFVRFFGWWAHEKLIAKKFYAVRVANEGADVLASLASHEGPLIGAMNHVSWWDPLFMLTLQRVYLPGRTIRAPMDAAQLERFGFFRKLGTFGINPDDPASLEAMGAYIGAYFRDEARPTLWITPQGRFADVREPVEIRPGAARLAAMDGRTRVVAVAVEYTFWLDARPEALLRFQAVEPRRAADGTASTAAWHRALRAAMDENSARLAEAAVTRDPARFRTLCGGDAPKISPFYDWWLRLRGKHGEIDDRRDRRDQRLAAQAAQSSRAVASGRAGGAVGDGA